MIKPRFYIGIILFALVIALMLFVAAPIQAMWGMWGLALTEVLLLICALVPALLLKWDLREVFPLKKPLLRQIFGVLVLWLGGYLAVISISIVTMYFFPQQMSDLGNYMVDVFKSVPFPVTFFILAVMPAICEEALNRGLVYYSFRGVNKWVTIISVGLLFGIFHLNPYRFVGTAFLGIILTYIMYETRNLLLPMLFHFVNNSLSAFSTLVSVPSTESTQTPLASVGIFLVIAAAVPFLLFGGSKLLRSKEDNRSRPAGRWALWAAVITTVLLFLTGVGITAAGVPELLEGYLPGEPIFETSFSGTFSGASTPNVLEFTVQESGAYLIDIDIQGSGIITTVKIVSSTGEEVYNTSGETFTVDDGSLALPAGDYTISFSYDYGSKDSAPVSVKVIIR